jgi:hypothetical protein
MANYAGWGCLCKTPECGTYHLAHFMGTTTKKIHFLPVEGPGWWDYGCLYCGNIHRYTRKDLTVNILEEVPPIGWTGWW